MLELKPSLNFALDSRRKSDFEPAPAMESTATKSTRIPMPPSHCVVARQSRMPRGMISTSLIALAPVVVKPEADSKMAAAGSNDGEAK